MNVEWGPLRSYFVYTNESRHVWRFVHFARRAASGDDAIEQAWQQARELGNEPQHGYMAVPADAITTREPPRCDARCGEEHHHDYCGLPAGHDGPHVPEPPDQQ